MSAIGFKGKIPCMVNVVKSKEMRNPWGLLVENFYFLIQEGSLTNPIVIAFFMILDQMNETCLKN